MDGVRGLISKATNGTTPAVVTTKRNIKMGSFKGSKTFTRKGWARQICFTQTLEKQKSKSITRHDIATCINQATNEVRVAGLILKNVAKLVTVMVTLCLFQVRTKFE